jgi:adenylate kinase family enzyme
MLATEQSGSAPAIQRLLILGSPGAGKSTLARKLATLTGLPLVHLDRLYWHSGWVESSDEEWTAQLTIELAKPCWIMDGNYNRTLPMRLARADAVIVLDYSTALCLARALQRILFRRWQSRPDLPPDCPEHFDAEFLRYIVRFRRDQRPSLQTALACFPGKKLILTSPSQISKAYRFLK